MKKLLLLLISSFIMFSAFAVSSIEGKVIDFQTKEPIVGATILVDSSLVGSVSDADGAFKILGVESGKKIVLNFDFIGYHKVSMVFTPEEGENKFVKPYEMKREDLLLEQVKITGSAATAIQKGDTVQYNAGAFKTNPDASAADLLAKLPGVEVEGGSIKADGEVVKRIYVDGKEYFADDPSTAANTISADMVESVQVYDAKSDDAEFSGIDDGKRVKTMNIVTKAKNKTTKTGDFKGGYGTDGRYMGIANINFMGKKHLLNIGGGLNNINRPATEGGQNVYYGNSSNGIQNTHGARLNYNGDFKRDSVHTLKVNLSYNFTSTKSNILKESNEFSTLSDYSYATLYKSESRTNNHNYNARIESQLGKKHKLRYYGSGTFSNGINDSYNLSNMFSDGETSNRYEATEDGNSSRINNNSNLGYALQLSDKSNFVLYSSLNINKNSGDQLLVGETSSLDNGVMVDSLINQNRTTLHSNNSVSINLGYNYKLDSLNHLGFQYGNVYNWASSDAKTYLYDENSGTYSDISSELSSILGQDYLTTIAWGGYNYDKKNKLYFSVAGGYVYNDMQTSLTMPQQSDRDYYFGDFGGSIYFIKTFSKSKKLLGSIYIDPELPSIKQLQDVLDTTNPLKVSTGNPNLDVQNSIYSYFRYTSNNSKKSTSLMIYAQANARLNNITQDITILDENKVINGVNVQKGAQFTTLSNNGTYLNCSTGVTYSMPIELLKSKLNSNLSYRYQSTPIMYDGELQNSTYHSPNLKLSLLSNITENVDFTVGNNIFYNHSKSTRTSSYIKNRFFTRLNLIFFKKLVVNSDYSYNYNHYSTPALNQTPTYHILNAGIGYKILDGNGEFRVSGYDLLDQNVSYSQNFNGEFITNVTEAILQRYIMFSFSYKFSTLKKGNSSNK